MLDKCNLYLIKNNTQIKALMPKARVIDEFIFQMYSVNHYVSSSDQLESLKQGEWRNVNICSSMNEKKPYYVKNRNHLQ